MVDEELKVEKIANRFQRAKRGLDAPKPPVDLLHQ
jgi:hypothetical protein